MVVAKVFVVLTLLLSSSAFAQDSKDKISVTESREALKLARTFSQRLQRTKDIAPLIDDYFAKDFMNGYVQDKDENWFIFLQRDVATKVSRAELRRYFIAELNWLYLCELYVFSKRSSRSEKDFLPEKIYPANVLKVFLSDTTMRATIEDKDFKESEIMIGTVERFRSFVLKLEHATRLLRKHARRINAGRTPQYRETLSDWTNRHHLYDPWLTTCEQTCLTMPKGTGLIVINVPSVQLQLAKVRGRMRIVSARFLLE